MWIDRPVFSLSMRIIPASFRESTCFLIAGNVRQSSVSRALMDTPCLLKMRYFRMSTFVLLQKSFSRFIAVSFE
jgi:hypothetical protein